MICLFQPLAVKTELQVVVKNRIIQFGITVKELQDIALDIFLFTSRRQIQLAMNWIPRDQNFQADFFSKIVDFDDYSVIDDVFFTSKSSGARILLTDLLAVTTLNCPGLIRDSFSRMSRLSMLSHKIGPQIITGLYPRQLSTAECCVTYA